MTERNDLDRVAERLAELLKHEHKNIVFAESCTGGLVSAVLTRIPGISQYHCGSAVVYQVPTKHHWLGISEALLNDPGPVSAEVARDMARRVLAKTPQADLAASVTGHLGPDAPSEQDGLLFIAVAVRRDCDRPNTDESIEGVVQRHRLSSEGLNSTAEPDDEDESAASPLQKRIRRQKAATALVLRTAADVLAGRIPLDGR